MKKKIFASVLSLSMALSTMTAVCSAAPTEPLDEEQVAFYLEKGKNSYYLDEDGIYYSSPDKNDFSVTAEEISAGKYWTTPLLQALSKTYPEGLFAVQFMGYIEPEKIEQDIERLGKLGIEAEIFETSKDFPLMICAVLTADQIENFPAAEDVGYKLGLAKKSVSTFEVPKTHAGDDVYDKGDIDGSKTIDVSDITELSLALIGDKELTAAQRTAADIDGDGAVTLADLARLRQYLSKKIYSLG